MLSTALLVDDDPTSNLIMMKILERAGGVKSIHAALNGKQAIDLLKDLYDKSQPLPGIIFLDLNMPIMNGFDFLIALHKLNFHDFRNTKIVVVSSSDNTEDIDTAKKLGVDRYLVKPICIQDVAKVL